MKYLLIVLCFLIQSSLLLAQLNYEWEYYYEHIVDKPIDLHYNEVNDQLNLIVQTIGQSDYWGDTAVWSNIHLSKEGELLHSYHFDADGDYLAAELKTSYIDCDGSVILGGEGFTLAQAEDYLIVKADENIEWATVYDGGIYGDIPGHILQDDVCNSYIISNSGLGLDSLKVFKLLPDGALDWTFRYLNSTNYTVSFNNAIYNDEALYLGGGIWDVFNLEFKSLLIKINNSGELEWEREIPLLGYYGGTGKAIVKDSSGYIYKRIAVHELTEGKDSTYLYKYNSEGELLWSRAYLPDDSPDNNAIHFFEYAPSGHLILGLEVSLDQNFDTIRMLSFDLNGELIWETSFDGRIQDCVMDRYGNIYVRSMEDTLYKVNSSGDLEGQISFPFCDSNYCHYDDGLTVDHQGGLYIWGQYLAPTDSLYNIFIHKYTDENFTTSAPSISKHSVQAYPNPFEELLVLETSVKDATVKIYNLLGELVHSGYANTVIDTNYWPIGTYVYCLEREGIIVNSRKLIKQ